ncbi:phage major capsid protein [Bradyrhizobium sp. SZCCHNR3065]|nr:phage major capsid protein [Bradyrhizobium sp. SZCCHNR3065]
MGAPIIATSTESRIISYVLSDESVARDGHRIFTDGIATANFAANPVFQWAHDTSGLPIGRVRNLRKAGGKLIGDVEYADHPFADMVYQLAREGFLNAVSISWEPIEWKYSTDNSRPGGIDFVKCDLLEVSQVPVPALPTALATARSIGIDTSPLAEWCERALDTKTFHPSLPRTDLAVLHRAATMSHTSKHVPAPGPTLQNFDATADMTSRGHRAFGVYLQRIASAIDNAAARKTLIRAGASEADPAAGGFLVGPQWSENLIYSIFDESVLARMVDRRETQAPFAEAKVPGIDETSRADGSRAGGFYSYWVGESGSVPTSFPRTKMVDFTGRKIVILTRTSRELLNDAPLLGSVISRGFAMEGGFKLDAAILSGKGTGTPLGILNSDCLITVSKENGQAAGTIVGENCKKMWSRLPVPCRRRAVWLVNEDAEAQLEDIGGASGQALYMPQGTGGNPYALLKGRPVMVIEQAPQLGTLGDITLVDPLQYILLDGGAKTALSVDARFDNDEVVFRFTWRVDGKGTYASPITPYNGSATRSPFIALAAR